jgi:phosphorylcholine metabolism protein LicD
MKKPAAFKVDNRANLVTISNLLQDIDHFVFFGTLLGLTRERDIIEDDDDIDILVPIEKRNLIIEKLVGVDNFKINLDKECNKFKYFLQVDSTINNHSSFIDFYFYENNPNEDFIVDRWNFLGKSQNPECALHIPKKFIFPVVHEDFFGQKIKLPACKELLCKWLYGKSWLTPRKKNISYVIRVIKNRPLLIKPIPRTLERFIPKPLRPLIERLSS